MKTPGTNGVYFLIESRTYTKRGNNRFEIIENN
jgi:hypothetical protein